MKDHRKVYAISKPYVSRNFKRTYLKNIEVYEGTIKKLPTSLNYNYFEFNADFLKSYTKKGKLVVKPSRETFRIQQNSPHNHLPTDLSAGLYQSQIIFTDFNVALAAKCILIAKLKQFIKQEFKRIEQQHNNSMPDTTSILIELQKENPELFV